MKRILIANYECKGTVLDVILCFEEPRKTPIVAALEHEPMRPRERYLDAQANDAAQVESFRLIGPVRDGAIDFTLELESEQEPECRTGKSIGHHLFRDGNRDSCQDRNLYVIIMESSVRCSIQAASAPLGHEQELGLDGQPFVHSDEPCNPNRDERFLRVLENCAGCVATNEPSEAHPGSDADSEISSPFLGDGLSRGSLERVCWG